MSRSLLDVILGRRADGATTFSADDFPTVFDGSAEIQPTTVTFETIGDRILDVVICGHLVADPGSTVRMSFARWDLLPQNLQEFLVGADMRP